MEHVDPAGTARRFGPYALAGPDGPLLCDGREVRLQRKTLNLLWLLVRQAGEVVTRSALHDAIWPRAVVGEEALTFQVQALRSALGDSARDPQYIATVHRVGFRFIAPVRTAGEPIAADQPSPRTPLMVGRDARCAQLSSMLHAARTGIRQIAFIGGGAGMGKSLLVDRWLEQTMQDTRPVLIGRGQCVEQRGPGEPYLPILQALDQLCREAGGASTLELMARLAPSWLGQIASMQASPAPMANVTRERTLRELVRLIEALSHAQPFVLVLEDLHWSDGSTIEALDLLAHRRQAAHLLVVCTYRPVEAIVLKHPVNVLRLELTAQQLVHDLPLDYLGLDDVSRYLAQRFPDRPGLPALARTLHERTEGHPLFIARIATDLERAAAGSEAEHIRREIPASLRELIAMQAGRCTVAEQQVLEIAGLAGMEFAAAAVAAAMQQPVESIESVCDGLARHGRFIEDRGLSIWPDGTASARYRFRHALYQAVLPGSLGAGPRARAHAAIGARLEAAYGERAREVAAELALHFQQAPDLPRAVHYLRLAADNAMARAAPAQAIPLLHQALESVAGDEDVELDLQTSLGVALMSTRGLAAPEAAQAFARAQALCASRHDDARSVPVLWGIFMFHLVRADFDAAGQVAEPLASLQGSRGGVHAPLAQGSLCLYRGLFREAAQHFDTALAAVERTSGFAVSAHAQDLRVDAQATAALVSWTMGQFDRACRLSAAALAFARTVVQPNSLAVSLFRDATLLELSGEPEAARERAAELIRFGSEQGLVHWEAAAQVLHGASSIEAGAAGADASTALDGIREGIARRRAMGVGLGLTYDLALLARACLRLGRIDEGLQAVDDAKRTMQASGERLREIDLLLVEGALHAAMSSGADRARSCFEAADALADRSGSPSWKLRALLGRIRIGSAPPADLAGALNAFDENIDSADLRQARSLLVASQA